MTLNDLADDCWENDCHEDTRRAADYLRGTNDHDEVSAVSGIYPIVRAPRWTDELERELSDVA
jgi:hypothetical protein